jgi:hypothetical protein
MTVTVELVPVPDDDLRPIVREHVCDIGKRYQLDQDPCGANFPLYAHPDTHVVYQAGFVEKAIRTYLLSSLVSKEHRPAIAAIVNRFAWTFVRLTMFDSGAEIIGDDLIILHSCCSDQAAVVVRISYFAG